MATPRTDAEPAEPAHRSRRRLVLLAAPAALILAGGVTAVVLWAGSDDARGEKTAELVAQRFVAAIDAGDKDAAAALSCANFADEARSVAASGADPDISFTRGPVRVNADGTGTAVFVERLKFSDAEQTERHTVRLQLTDGLWLLCGDA